jgi:hypothetical protein
MLQAIALFPTSTAIRPAIGTTILASAWLAAQNVSTLILNKYTLPSLEAEGKNVFPARSA